MARKIKTGDEIISLSGKDKGRTGKVLSVSKNGTKVVVDGMNIAKQHVRPNPNKNEPGGIKEIAKPMWACKVAIYNAQTGKGDRVGFKTLEDGRVVRIFKSTGEQIDV